MEVTETEAAVKWLETQPVGQLRKRFHSPSTQPLMQFKWDHAPGTWHMCGICRMAGSRLIVVDSNAE